MKFDSKKTIFLIDGSSFLYRAYYSLRPLHTLQGEPVQAVYGFCRMLKKLIDTFHPAYCAVVWDSKGKTTRHEMYQEYKATRQAPPSDLFDQKERILEFAELINLKQVMCSGIEADDIMFSLAQEQKKSGNTIVFVTADKDMAQALDDHVVMYDTFKEQLIDQDIFEKNNGFPVEKLPFYYSLLGDASDNIPGVKGIGKKGALELVQQFDSLHDLYAHLDEIKKPRLRTALEENKEKAFLSRELFLLQYQPTGVSKKELDFDEKDWIEARSFFQALNFKSLLKDMEKDPRLVEQKIIHWQGYDFRLVTTLDQLQELVELLKKKKVCALDTETDGVRPLQDNLVGVSFCVKKGQSFYVPCAHTTGERHLARSTVIEVLKPLLENAAYKKIFHNAKFDQLVLRNNGIFVKGTIFDTLIAGRLVSRDWQSSTLKFMSHYYLHEQMLTYDDVVKRYKRSDFAQVPLDLATLYSAADAHQTFCLKPLLEKELEQQKLKKVYNQIEFPLIDVLVAMEARGIYLDVSVLQRLDTRITKKLMTIKDTIIDEVGPAFSTINLNSPKQIEKLLFEELKLPTQKKRAKSGGFSTDQEVLQILAHQHKVPRLLLVYRELSKLKNTYIDALPAYINPKTGRIHTHYSQTGVATGRLASSEPNLQNIPATDTGVPIRGAFKPQAGNCFLSADYSQIELRVLAHLSQDEHLIEAFLKNRDIHAQTAAGLFDVPLSRVTHEERQIGKRINFSILYGLTPYGLSQDLGISFTQAKHYIEKFFAQYPRVSSWMAHIVKQTEKFGYVTTLWGRKRFIPTIYEKNQALYQEAKRVAINTVAQGTAAELMKLGMISLHNAFKQETQALDAHLLLQIHDELLITLPETKKRVVSRLVKEHLEGVVDWRVPLEVTTVFGSTWEDVTK